jgi:hypothetical protein
MTCRACHFDHPKLIRCEVAARQRAAKALVAHEDGHRGPQPRNQSVTREVVTRNQCAECAAKNAEIALLRGRVTELEVAAAQPKMDYAETVAYMKATGIKPKRDRADYMRERRAEAKRQRETGFIGVPYG